MRDGLHHIHTTSRHHSLSSSSRLTVRRLPGRLAIILFACLLLLSACSDHSSQLKILQAQKTASADLALRAGGQLQLETFQQWIGLLRQFDGQTSTYGQELLRVHHHLDTARTTADYRKVLQTLQKDIADIKMPTLKTEADYQLQQLTRQVAAWGETHTYRDNYNDTTYHMGYEYGPDGVSGWIQDELAGAKTIGDYLQAVEDANTFLANFQAYQSNASDPTPWNRPHQTDLQLMRRYHTTAQKVVIVSLNEETMRIYDHGNLVKALRVTTGRPEKPSLPGSWTIENKQAPTIFKSDQPKGSAYWYPDTPIHYAMLYHSGGYYLHDSWWRADYGPTTQFPHYDSSGDSFSFDGTHGCVNFPTDEAAWVYNYVDFKTPVIIY